MPDLPAPAEIAAALEQRVFGQTMAVREAAIALAKHLADLVGEEVRLHPVDHRRNAPVGRRPASRWPPGGSGPGQGGG